MNCACKNCTERHIGCHNDCEEYKEFKTQVENFKRQKVIDKAKRGEPVYEWEARRFLIKSTT